MTETDIPGMFVGVVRGDSVIYQNSSGKADLESGSSLSSHTCMELGSVTKLLTAELTYKLLNDGLLDLSDPIGKYFPGAPASWSGITIQHLLQHSSGIPNYLLDPRFRGEALFTNQFNDVDRRFFNSITSDSMTNMFFDLPLEFKPGSNWSYSNTGYYLLGKMIERIKEKDFFDVVREQIIIPLGMTNTVSNEMAATMNCRANGYFLQDTLLKESALLPNHYALSAGAITTNGADMLRFLKACHSSELPSDKAGVDLKKRVHTDHLPFTYNGGRFYTRFHGLTIISHNGGTPGFSSSWIYVPERAISVVVLINLQDHPGLDQLSWDILSWFEPELRFPARKRKGGTEGKLEALVMRFVCALKKTAPYPKVMSEALRNFLSTENGSGFWRWYFSKGFPISASCVDMEQIGADKLYRFLLPTENGTTNRLSVLVNSNGEWMQIRWW